MFKIGDFSKLNKISIKTLRYYDELNLLKPIKVDSDTGYRFYSANQLPKLNKIIVLKEMGFSLSKISEILQNNLSSDAIVSMLNFKKLEIEENIKNDQEKLNRIKSMINKIKEEDISMLNYDIIIKEVGAIKVAYIRDIIPDYSRQCHLWEELSIHLNKHNVKITRPCLSIYYDPGYTESNVDIEVASHIIDNAPETERIKVKELEAIKKMACVIHKGSYENLTEAYTSIQKWIEENNYKIVGPNRELYLEGEWSTKDPNNYITEIQIPIEKSI